MDALSPELAGQGAVDEYAPEQSLLVASVLCMSGGFLDAFAWLSLGGVFANSQTGNFVFLGMYAAAGRWDEAARHVPPILAFLAGAWVASYLRAPLFCLVVEIVCLATVTLLLHRLPESAAVVVISFGVAMQTASFRHIERWKYISVTVTGNMLRAVGQLVLLPDPEAARGAKAMLAVCLMFLLGAATGGWLTMRLAANALLAPIGLLTFALALCVWNRFRRRES